MFQVADIKPMILVIVCSNLSTIKIADRSSDQLQQVCETCWIWAWCCGMLSKNSFTKVWIVYTRHAPLNCFDELV